SMPHFVVWELRLRRAHKIAITAIFTLGLLNIVMGALRMWSQLSTVNDGDPTYDALPDLIWALATLSTAIMVACCPLLRPLFEKCIPTRLTHIHLIKRPSHAPAISVTTRIDVFLHTSQPRIESSEDEHHENEGPTFEVRQFAPELHC
ncbi:hypothetical protein EJ04DRAFT_423306, partial [Polyplosphaeria fusca]